LPRLISRLPGAVDTGRDRALDQVTLLRHRQALVEDGPRGVGDDLDEPVADLHVHLSQLRVEDLRGVRTDRSRLGVCRRPHLGRLDRGDLAGVREDRTRLRPRIVERRGRPLLGAGELFIRGLGALYRGGDPIAPLREHVDEYALALLPDADRNEVHDPHECGELGDLHSVLEGVLGDLVSDLCEQLHIRTGPSSGRAARAACRRRSPWIPRRRSP
jgi:hypothetical protein